MYDTYIYERTNNKKSFQNSIHHLLLDICQLMICVWLIEDRVDTTAATFSNKQKSKYGKKNNKRSFLGNCESFDR